MGTNPPDEFKLEGEYSDNALILNLENYDGPLHVLLQLAREQKVDLTRISILRLTEQYLDFINKVKKHNIDIAGDYLVMAAWLAYLKSRLLLPKQKIDKEEIAPEILSSHLAWRLKRLEAMREVGEKLKELPQLKQDFFTRGEIPDNFDNIQSIYEADIIDLLRAYGKQRNKIKAKVHKVKPWPVFSLEEARMSLKTKVPNDNIWRELASFAPTKKEIQGEMPSPKSRYASLLSAGLEMVKQGEINMKQVFTYDNVYLRKQNDSQK